MRNVTAVLMTLTFSIGLLGSATGTALAQSARPVVVLDPGHGWSTGTGIIDPGAVSGGLVEKEITLDVARQAQELLERCEVDVYLTHERDEYGQTEAAIPGIVNGYNPTLAVSIHANSGDPGASGTQAWHTVVGYNDAASQALAAMLADSVASQFSIPNLGAIPESHSPQGELTIHGWNAPAAQLDLAFLQGDADLLRSPRSSGQAGRRDFARAVARALLSFLDLPLDCVDHAEGQGFALVVYSPNETHTNSVALLNDGLLAWDPGSFELRSTSNPYGAPERIPLPTVVEAGDLVTWDIPATAPSGAGIYRQTWQLHKGELPIDSEATVVLIVIPQEATELKEEIERRIEEIAAQGQQQIEQQLEELRRQIMEAAEQKFNEWIGDRIGGICKSGAAAGMAAVALVWSRRRESRKSN